MNERQKTFSFFLIALLVLIPALYLSRPETETFTAEQMVEKELFPELKDVMNVASFSISQLEPSGKLTRLEVKKMNGQWILSSHSGYPANAQNRMVEVVSALSGLEVLRVVGEDAATRARCGVLDPEDAQNAEPKEAGSRIVIRNQKDQLLFDLILGQETEEGSGKFYVRRAGQNPVYVVEMDPSRLSTKFLDWIETDLMKVQPSDIASLFALDCSLELKTQDGTPAFNHRGQFTVTQKYLEDPDWELTSNLRVFGTGMREMGMPAGQTLNLRMLRRISQALSDMRLCSVQRKPSEIANAFRHPENLELTEDQNRLLQERGFCTLPMDLGNGPINALFSTDGQVHVYSNEGVVYRLYFGGIAGTEALEDFMAATGTDRKFYRYLVLTADLYPQGIPQPQLQEMPPKPEDSDAAAKAQYQALLEMNAQEQRIYEEKLADARKKVEQMNALFADWFFIIPEDVYQQIHMTYANVFISRGEAERMKQDETKEPEHAQEHEPDHEHSAEECHDGNCPIHSHENAEQAPAPAPASTPTPVESGPAPEPQTP